MKRLLILAAYALTLSYSTVLAQRAPAHQKPQQVTLLRIEETAYLATERKFVITSDSLVVRDRSVGVTDTLYTKRLTTHERNWLLASFDKTYLSAIKENYESSSDTNHDWHYRLVIYNGDSLRVVNIYKAKLDCFYTFAQRFNLLVPESYRLHYTAAYFND